MTPDACLLADPRAFVLLLLEEWRNSISSVVSSVDSSQVHGESGDLTAEQLVGAAQAGDSDAFGQLVTLYQNEIAVQLSRFSRQQNVIEELVHESFVEAWLSLSSFRAKSPFLHWLRKIAVRVGYRHWKNQGRSRREESLEAGHLLEELSHFEAQPATEVAEHLHALLQLIKPRNRLVLTMLYWEEHNVAQAAKLLGWSQSMVKVQAWRARRELKELIERAEHE